MSLRLFFEPRDLWIGVYVSEWRESFESYDGTPSMEYRVRIRTIYVCPVPMFGFRWDQVQRS